ncbi:protein TonB [bacterium A37T11]|nr:protein TonB [bacterium A37T11]
MVKFVIDRTGKVTDAQIVQPLYPSLDEEALRLVRKMPRWKPGQQKGKAHQGNLSIADCFQLSIIHDRLISHLARWRFNEYFRH